MASLKTLTATKRSDFPQVTETNVEAGQIFHFSMGANFEVFNNGICFKPCQSGTAIVELWGAGGSAAQMCCCGFGLPGNPGAYNNLLEICFFHFHASITRLACDAVRVSSMTSCTPRNACSCSNVSPSSQPLPRASALM